jgi:hypothetical protein
MHGFGAVASQHGEVVHFTRGAGFHHQTGGTQALAHQVLVNGRQRQQRRNGHLQARDATVADDQDVFAAIDGIHRFCAQRSQLGFHTFMTPHHG